MVRGMRIRREVTGERDSGFSLVELVVAMIVIATVIVMLLVVQTSAVVTIVNASRIQQATAFGNQAMEAMRSVPWNTLKTGNSTNFAAASGGDPFLTGTSTIIVDGATYTVVRGTQTLTNPKPPLFSSTGSNLVTLQDPSIPGVSFEIRAYVVNALGGTVGAVGLLVIVRWTSLESGTSHNMVLRSTAYAPSTGCGSLDTQPYLGSCQDRYNSVSASGFATTSIASSDGSTGAALPLVNGSDARTLTMRTAFATGTDDSIQATNVTGTVLFGGVSISDADGGAAASGFSTAVTAASDDNATLSGYPDDSYLASISATGDNTLVSSGSSSFYFSAQSDYGRTGSSRSSVNTACLSGALQAGQPCFYTALSGGSQASTRSYVAWGYQGAFTDVMYPFWREGGATNSYAGGGRFAAAKPTSTNYGCQTLTGSGCVSARAEYVQGLTLLGYIPTTSGKWSSNKQSVVEIGAYTDSVLVQRGASQKATPPTFAKSGSVNFWNGSSFATSNFTTATNGTIANTSPVTWTSTDGAVTITATAVIAISKPFGTPYNPSPTCTADVCSIDAGTGSLTVTIEYVVSSPSGTHTFTQDTTITGSSATASFKDQI
jgi:prepilin-type N-terminal cleavage/methylation domain-containing protein